MVIFADFPEAQARIERDFNKLSIEVQPETIQHWEVGDNRAFLARELQNYVYTVVKPDYHEVERVHEAWLRQEWLDRLTGGLNPGNAWKERPEVWEALMEPRGRGDKNYLGFSYTYSQRMGGDHIQKIIEELKRHPHSRQLWLPVWTTIDETRRGSRRVPCSLGYWFVYRDEKLHMTYMMRSCDYIAHYGNDVALATALLHYVAKKADMEPGTFTHVVGSLHIYAKDGGF